MVYGWSYNERSEFESESVIRHASCVMRHASCVMRLASFGDLATAATSFWTRILSFAGISPRRATESMVDTGPGIEAGVTTPAPKGSLLAENWYAASEQTPFPAPSAMLPGLPDHALDRSASASSPSRSIDATVQGTVGDFPLMSTEWGTHFAYPEANGMHRNDLTHIIATKKSSTSLTSTCKCQHACMLGG